MNEKVEDLVRGDLIAQDLKTVLAGLCDLVKNQQKQIFELQNRLDDSVQMQVFSSKMEYVDKEINDIKEGSNNYKESINENLNKLEKRLNLNEELINTIKNEIKDRIKDIILDINERFESHSLLTSRQLLKCKEQIQNTNTNVESSFKQIQDLHDILDQFGLERISNIIEDIDEVKCQGEAFKNAIHQQLDQNALIYQKIEKTEKNILEQVKLTNKKIFTKLQQHELLIEKMPDSDVINPETGQVDINSILRAVQRNSRRIDHFDKQMSSLQLDFDKTNMCSKECSNQVQSNACNINFLSDELFKTRFELSELSKQQHSGFQHISKEFKTLWSLVEEMQESNAEDARDQTHIFDEIYHQLIFLTKAKMEFAQALDDVAIRADSLFQKITEQKLCSNISSDLSGQIEINTSQPLSSIDAIKIPFDQQFLDFSESRSTNSFTKSLAEFVSSIKIDDSVSLNSSTSRTDAILNDMLVKKDVGALSKRISELESSIATRVSNTEYTRMLQKIQETTTRLQQQMMKLQAAFDDHVALKSHPSEKPPVQNQSQSPVQVRASTSSLPRPLTTCAAMGIRGAPPRPKLHRRSETYKTPPRVVRSVHRLASEYVVSGFDLI